MSSNYHANNKLPEDPERVFDVLQAVSGNVAEAARRFSVDPHTIRNWLNAADGRQERLTEIRKAFDNDLLDQATSTTMRNLQSGDGRISNRAAQIVYQYMGKRRGYVPASYVEQDNNQDVTITVVREEE